MRSEQHPWLLRRTKAAWSGLPMLYQLYETQRALMAPFAEFASASSKLYSHPLSPFTHAPMAQRVAAGFDLMHRLAKEYEKPEFDITKRHGRRHRGRGAGAGGAATSRSAGCCASSASPTTPPALAHDEDAADRAGGRAAVGPPLRRCCATRCSMLLQRPQGLHHRLDRRAHGAGSTPARSTSTTTCLRAGVHPPHRPRGAT